MTDTLKLNWIKHMQKMQSPFAKSWFDHMFRRDEAGFPDFEDVDLPPSSFMWNQQSDEHIEWEFIHDILTL